MSYLDEEIIEEFKKNNVTLITLTEDEHNLITDKINEQLPFCGSQIAWDSLKGSTYLGTATSPEVQNSLAEKIIPVSYDLILIVGDATDNAYAINLENLTFAIKVFSTIPQHTYITQKNLTWIACISFEGYVDFSTI
ncbi:hypothetical protein [Pseudomonas sp. P7548]|jgi:hypothetical protein|uniref:hypothetical protein n=1 Tax=Pseudomonas sp. P7548 TaxID=2726981 RepID=UPI0015BF001B|nr:hypothetical protein [Pseudomonas sp. P7548]NWE23326.1 hypothetical protein [Pseudomonas sp. P7548]